MKVLAVIIAVYAPLMLLLHVFTGKILSAWKKEPDSWISRLITSRRLLRTEALFWVLALASWFLWRSLGLKFLVIAFAGIHLVIWFLDELAVNEKAAFSPKPTMVRAIVAFDLVEAVVLAGIGTVAILYLTQVR